MDVTDRVSRRQALLTALLAPFAGHLPSFSGLSSETFDMPISPPTGLMKLGFLLPVTDEQIADYDRDFQEQINMRLSIMIKRSRGIALSQAEQAYLDSLPPPQPEPVLDSDPYHRYLRDGEPWPDEWEDDEW